MTTSHQCEIAFGVVFNLTRFARDKYDHFALRSLLQSLGISLRSVTEPIDDTSTGKLMEGVLAAFAQFDNDCRSGCDQAPRNGRPGRYWGSRLSAISQLAAAEKVRWWT